MMMMIDGDDIDGPLNAVQRKRRGEGGRRRRRIIGKKPSDEKTAEAGDPAMRSALLSVEAERKKKERKERRGRVGLGRDGDAGLSVLFGRREPAVLLVDLDERLERLLGPRQTVLALGGAELDARLALDERGGDL